MSDTPERKLYVEEDWKSKVQQEREPETAPKAELHVDSDWKAQAQAEKERLAADEEKRSSEKGEQGRDLPEASFRTLVSVLASQAIMGLGTMADPQTGGVVVDLEGAKLSIDLLQVLEEKTKGNLSDEEAKEVAQLLTELRSRFVQIAKLVAQQSQGGGAAMPGAVPGMMPPPGPAGGL